MSKSQPWGENQALHLIHRARRETPRARLDRAGHARIFNARRWKRSWTDRKTRHFGLVWWKRESPGFSHGECQIYFDQESSGGGVFLLQFTNRSTSQATNEG